MFHMMTVVLHFPAQANAIQKQKITNQCRKYALVMLHRVRQLRQEDKLELLQYVYSDYGKAQLFTQKCRKS
jgi:hypothetical protein